MARRLIIVLLIVNGLLLPLGCLPLVMLTAPINPLVAGFVTPFHVTNASDEPIRVTPIGAYGAEPRRAPLPIYVSMYPAWPSGAVSRLTIAPGERRTILYNYDDYNLSELVIETDAGRSGVFIVNPEPAGHYYYPPDPNEFVIEDPGVLPTPSAEVQAAFNTAISTTFTYGSWWWTAFLLVPWLTFTLLLVLWQRARRGATGNAAHALLAD